MERSNGSWPSLHGQSFAPDIGLDHHLLDYYAADLPIRLILNEPDLHHECDHAVRRARTPWQPLANWMDA